MTPGGDRSGRSPRGPLDPHAEGGGRPVDPTPLSTAELPATPVRDRTIPATAWVEAPEELLSLGADLGHELVAYKRRIGPWLLWRAGPATGGDARYLAVRADDPSVAHSFRLHPDGTGDGVGPSGARHQRFRTWKEDLLGKGSGGGVTGPM